MKGYFFNVALAVTVLAMAVAYYFGHDFINQLLIQGPIRLTQLVTRWH